MGGEPWAGEGRKSANSTKYNEMTIIFPKEREKAWRRASSSCGQSVLETIINLFKLYSRNITPIE